MPQSQPRAAQQLVVALHDAAPPFEDAIRAQLALLAAIGVRRVSLLVTPNWHGDAPLNVSPGFVDLLREQVAAGSQLVLHGYLHQPDPGAAFMGPWQRRLRARLFARDAAEFLTLTPAEAEGELRQGLADFEQVGLPRPTTFCAPGWLSNAAAEAALPRAGLRYLISMFGVRDLWSDWRIRAPSVGYMGAGNAQELGVQTLNTLVRWTKLPRAPVACVYLHPQGQPTGPRVRRQIALVSKLLGRGWQLATYDDLFDARALSESGEPGAPSSAFPARHAS